MRKEDISQIIIAHSSLAEYEFDGDDADRYYLPARGLAEAPAYIQQGVSTLVIVPRHQAIGELARFYQKTLLRGKNIDLIETPDDNYLMDRDISGKDEVLAEVLNRLKPGRVMLYPYGVTDEFMSWARLLIERGCVLIGDKKRYLDRKWWGHKAGLHRWLDDLDELSFAELVGLPVATGYVAQNKKELLKASRLLHTTQVILKPYILSGGFKMRICNSREDIESYEMPMMPRFIDQDERLMPVAVEKVLDIERDEMGEMVYSAQFTGANMVGGLTRQVIHGGLHWGGNVVPSGASGLFEHRVENIVNRFLTCANPQGPGGVDLASVNGKPIILEINGGRPTGAHSPKMFKTVFSPYSEAAIFEKEDREGLLDMDVEYVWDKLNTTTFKNKPMAFNLETGYGVYPLVWLKGLWSMLVAFGESISDSKSRIEEAKAQIF